MSEVLVNINGFRFIAEYEVSKTPEDPESGLFGTIEITQLKSLLGFPASWFEDKLTLDDWQTINDACHEHSYDCFPEDY